MSIKIQSVVDDVVIKSAFAVGQSSYEFALENLLPLAGRYDQQRKKQSAKFYTRLRKDIVKGCVMPPITLAFVSREFSKELELKRLENYINENVTRGYILDGLQRLNTLQAASHDDGFSAARPIFINIIVAEKYDFLLYRMITLNNGQKPMTPRHQIEILTQNLLDFEEFKNIVIQTEKETENSLIHGAFKLADISAAYTAFLTNNPNNDNNKIIDEKMNEILVGRVMSTDLDAAQSEFSDVLRLVDKFCVDKDARKWLKIQNNIIGFTLGVKKSHHIVSTLDPVQFSEELQKFETAFKAINPSKVNVGRFRRELSQHFFENIQDYLDKTSDDIAEIFFENTISD
jgi:hypothetical protein